MAWRAAMGDSTMSTPTISTAEGAMPLSCSIIAKERALLPEHKGPIVYVAFYQQLTKV
jgi:hypothetical protein